MYESELQETVSEIIINREVSTVEISITDNGFAVVIKAGELDAAYTAEEARHLADSLDQYSGMEWDYKPHDVIEYIRDLADVVDGDKGEASVAEKWEDRELDSTL